jgi:hypothetical protein
MRWPSTWAFFLLKQNQGPGVVDGDDVDLDNDLKRTFPRPSTLAFEVESCKKCEKKAQRSLSAFHVFRAFDLEKFKHSTISTNIESTSASMVEVTRNGSQSCV